MGKLGGYELNFGSDIDLTFFYGTDHAKVKDNPELRVHDFFSLVVRNVTRALSEITEDGFVFRVDLRLRPEGSRGPLANSLASAERYYESFGRTWERAALLRAKPIAGDIEFGNELLSTLRPFVYRREVDPKLAQKMHEMMRKARRDLRVDDERNIKLGRGGIREAEFFVQALQLIWGGQHRELQVPGTIDALKRLQAQGLVSHGEAHELENSWALLRRVEHRIHMLTGYQTHDVPHDQTVLAHSLGFPDVDVFEHALHRARTTIRCLFDSLLEEEPLSETRFEPLLDALLEDMPDDGLLAMIVQLISVREPDEALAHLRRLCRLPLSPFGVQGRSRFPQLAETLLQEIDSSADVDSALRYLAELLMRGGFGLDALLNSEPRVTRRIIGLFGASPTLARALVSHPEAIAEIILGPSAPSPSEIDALHQPLTSSDDMERFVSSLRRLKRELTLVIGMAYVASEINTQSTEQLLSHLAEAQLRTSFSFALHQCRKRFDVTPNPIVVVGLGKLGSCEMGFASDLDLIFLYENKGVDSDSHSQQEIMAWIASRVLRMLSQPDSEGPGYETDTRLRPNGSQGLLVTSLSAFERYHKTRASEWERQALLRARVVAYNHTKFSNTVAEHLQGAAYSHQDYDSGYIAPLRKRIQLELAGEKPSRYHPKLGYGALIDIEFLVQSLQMKFGTSLPQLRVRTTSDAIRELEKASIINHSIAEALLDGHTFFRRTEHALALLDQKEKTLSFGGPRARSVARALGLRARDNEPPDQVLQAMWQRRAHEIRTYFESIIAPVHATAPWKQS